MAFYFGEPIIITEIHEYSSCWFIPLKLMKWIFKKLNLKPEEYIFCHIGDKVIYTKSVIY